MVSSINMQKFKFIVMSLMLCCLFACQTKQPAPSDKVVIDDLNLMSLENQNSAINKAIHKLEIGKILEAEILINQVFQVNPSHPTAKLLKRQLTTEPKFIFNTTRVTQYQIKAGDTLGSIAKHWLGNALYFVSLAKLNNIRDTTLIQPGLLIKIPVMKNSPLVNKENRRSRANLDLLTKYSEEKRYLKSLIRMTSIFVVKKDHNKLLSLQSNTLINMAESKVSIGERKKMIEQLKSISADSKRTFLDANFDQFIQQQSLAVLLDEFVLLFEAKSYQNAANKLVEAKQIIASQQSAQEHPSTYYYRTEKLLINKLHEQAVLQRKNQQLQEAVDSWGLILKIQPDNDLALKYYHRTNRLLERLKKL